MEYTHDIPISTTQDYEEIYGVECPRCLTNYKDIENIEWISQFKECLVCDHLHNDEIEEATHG